MLPKSTKLFGAPKVAVVITVYNESDNILHLLGSLRKQTLPPDEVIIVDGGSTDDTFILVNNYTKTWHRLKVYQAKGNRSVGRNFGVSHSSAPLIAFTDAGCYPEPDWLEKLTRPFSDPTVQVVSGYYLGQSENIFQKCLIPYVLVMPDQAGKTEFYPSTRSMALRRTVWNKSGGFDIRLDHNEDYAYSHWLKKLGYNFTFASEAIVRWLPRKDLASAFWMFLRFAIGDIQSGIVRPQVKRLFVRFLSFIFIIALSIELPVLFYLVGLLLIAYSLFAIKKNFRYVRHLQAFIWLPVLQLTVDTALLMGTAIGLLNKQ